MVLILKHGATKEEIQAIEKSFIKKQAKLGSMPKSIMELLS